VAVAAAEHDGRASLAVRDDGPGIPAADQEHLFERFYRADGGGVASGSGLGLAIARELAMRMGGMIELRSEPRQTTFTLLLPLSDPADMADFTSNHSLVADTSLTGAGDATRS
jgi:two-component system, OmpR family, sensor kinase